MCERRVLHTHVDGHKVKLQRLMVSFSFCVWFVVEVYKSERVAHLSRLSYFSTFKAHVWL